MKSGISNKSINFINIWVNLWGKYSVYFWIFSILIASISIVNAAEVKYVNDDKSIEEFKTNFKQKNYEFKLIKSVKITDAESKQKSLYKFKQFYKNILVWDTVIVSDNESLVNSSKINGKYLNGINTDIDLVNPKISQEEAEKKFKNIIIENSQDENISIQNINTQLVIKNYQDKAKLVYIINAFIDSNKNQEYPKRIYNIIDAHSNEVLETWNGLTSYQIQNKKNSSEILSGKDKSLDDLYKKIFGINNIDIKNIKKEKKDDAKQAYWTGDKLIYNNKIELEDVSHELARVFTEYNSNLKYQGESGAVSEAFSIFAAKKNDNLDINLQEQLTAIEHARDFCILDSNKENSAIFTKAFYNIINTDNQNWNKDKLFEILLLANQLYWNEESNLDNAACGIKLAAESKNYNSKVIIDEFTKLGVNANCKIDDNLNKKTGLDSKKIIKITNPGIHYSNIKDDDKNYSYKLIAGDNDYTEKSRYRYKQYYKSLLVYDSNVVINKPTIGCLRPNDPVIGVIYKNIESEISSVEPKITKKQAMQIAMQASSIKDDKKINNLKTELYLYIKNNKIILVYDISFIVYNPKPSAPKIIIDANNGNIIDKFETLHEDILNLNTKHGSPAWPTFGVINFNSPSSISGLNQKYVIVKKDGINCYLDNQRIKTYEVTTINTPKVPANITTGYKFDCISAVGGLVTQDYLNYSDTVSGPTPIAMLGSLTGSFGSANMLYNYYLINFSSDNFLNPTNKISLKVSNNIATNYQASFYEPIGPSVNLSYGAWWSGPKTLWHELGHHIVAKNSNFVGDTETRSLHESFADMTALAIMDFYQMPLDMKNGTLLSVVRNTNHDNYDDIAAGRASGVHKIGDIFSNAFLNLAQAGTNHIGQANLGWGVQKTYKTWVKANQVYWKSNDKMLQAAKGVCDGARDLGYNTENVKQAFSNIGITAECSVLTQYEVKINSVAPGKNTNVINSFIATGNQITLNGVLNSNLESAPNSLSSITIEAVNLNNSINQLGPMINLATINITNPAVLTWSLPININDVNPYMGTQGILMLKITANNQGALVNNIKNIQISFMNRMTDSGVIKYSPGPACGPYGCANFPLEPLF